MPEMYSGRSSFKMSLCIVTSLVSIYISSRLECTKNRSVVLSNIDELCKILCLTD